MPGNSINSTAPLYAVIDLGSNSFHMSIIRLVAGNNDNGIQTLAKIKRKVRLASGLDENNTLNDSAIERGLQCLRFFAERLQDIPPENIKVVATATLRIANNANIFIVQAEKILSHKIRVLSGLEEAQHIYLGVAYTSCCAKKRLVLDIGGASTELIVGEGVTINKAISVNMGCVSFNKHYFTDQLLNDDNFDLAISAAKKILAPLVQPYQNIGWQSVLGGSGTMQALAEILAFRKQPSIIHRDFLAQIKADLIICQKIDTLSIDGLKYDRKPVFASGLAILIAIFDHFSIDKLQLSSGALREGLLYSMLPEAINETSSVIPSIKQQTINQLSQRFHIDQPQAKRVQHLATQLFNHCQTAWNLTHNDHIHLLSACALHEIGLILSYKDHLNHGVYLLNNSELVGFEGNEGKLLVALIGNYQQNITLSDLEKQTAVHVNKAKQLLALLRVSIILSQRRIETPLEYIESIEATAIIDDRQENGLSNVTPIHALQLTMSPAWLSNHPLIAYTLQQETTHLIPLGIKLTLVS